MRPRSPISLVCAVLSVISLFPFLLTASSFHPYEIHSSEGFFTVSNFEGRNDLVSLSEGKIRVRILGRKLICEVLPPGTITRLMAADVDRDGDLDLLVHTHSSGLEIWYNDGCGHFSRNPFPQIGSGSVSGDFSESTECSSSLCQEPKAHYFALPLSIEIFGTARPSHFSTGFFFRSFSRPPPLS